MFYNHINLNSNHSTSTEKIYYKHLRMNFLENIGRNNLRISSHFFFTRFSIFHIVDKIKNITNYLHDTNKKEDINLTLDLSNILF